MTNKTILVSLLLVCCLSFLSCEKKKEKQYSFLQYHCKSKYCLLMLGKKSCPVSKGFKHIFLYKIKVKKGISKLYVNKSKYSMLARYATPLFLLYQRGRTSPIDLHVGAVSMKNSFGFSANQKIISNLLIRNNIITGKYIYNNGLGFIHNLKDMSYRSIKFRRAPSSNFSFKKMKFMILSGVDLRGSNFDGVQLHNTIFSHCNLKNSTFRQADLKNNIWIRTICPDGTFSPENGRSCKGHLEKKH